MLPRSEFVPLRNFFLTIVIFIACCAQHACAQAEPAWVAQRQSAERLYSAGDLDGSERDWRSALDAAEKSSQVEPGVVTCLVGLATVYDKRGQGQEAERLYELAMRNMEGLVGPSSPRFADWMPRLAHIYDAHGHPERAEVLFKRALQIKTFTYGAEDPRIADLYDEYGSFLKKNGRHIEATSLEEKARVIRQKLSP